MIDIFPFLILTQSIDSFYDSTNDIFKQIFTSPVQICCVGVDSTLCTLHCVVYTVDVERCEDSNQQHLLCKKLILTMFHYSAKQSNEKGAESLLCVLSLKGIIQTIKLMFVNNFLYS